MSRQHHFLAILPLLSILSMSPSMLEQINHGRSLASVEAENNLPTFPKYEARAEQADRSHIIIDKDLDRDCLKEQTADLKSRLIEEKKKFNKNELDKEKIKIQKARLQDLILSMIQVEENFNALKGQNVLSQVEIQLGVQVGHELKEILEGLISDDMENDVLVGKEEIKKEKPIAKNDEELDKDEDIEKEEKEKETKKEDEKSDQEKKICDLEEKNKVLTKQVDDLLAEQKKILETMLGMNTTMTQMHQQMQSNQQQYAVPSWLMSGSLVNPYLQYPYHSSPVIIMIGNQGPVMGQQTYEKSLMSGQYQYQPLSQPESPYFQPHHSQNYQWPVPIVQQPQDFGVGALNSPFSFNFT